MAANFHRLGVAERPDRSAEFIFLIFARLVRPWQIFRLVRKISPDLQDDKLMGAEIGIVPERLLAQLSRWVELFKDIERQGSFDPEVVALAVYWAGQARAGFRRDAAPRPDGRLDRRLHAIAGEIGATMDTLMKRAVPALLAAVPRETVRCAGRVMVDVLPSAKRIDAEKLAQAQRLLRLVAATRLTARAAAFGGERDVVERRLQPELDAIQAAALRSLQDPALRMVALAWLEPINMLFLAFSGPEAAAVVRRRMAAA